ncbi:MAG: NIPSNAP family containing protein [Armatimonadetes bacterium]|nr:NIPSNAP family containing protein [Armatimonadota bacterium]
MTIQLRRYVIHKNQMDEFVKVWRDGVVPLRKKHGFRVLGAWITHDRNEFVWLVAHDGNFAAADAAYYASPERGAITPNPSSFIAKSEVTLAASAVP